MKRRFRTAWDVWRHGLPVVEVTHRFTPRESVVEVVYKGRCHGVFNGEDTWSDDGTFSVCVPLAEPVSP